MFDPFFGSKNQESILENGKPLSELLPVSVEPGGELSNLFVDSLLKINSFMKAINFSS